MKRALSLVLALALLAGVPAFAEEEKGTMRASSWAVAELERACEAGIFPEEIDPYRDDCTRGMIRGEFAAITVRLYEVLGGNLHKAPSFQQLHPHPFLDIDNYDYKIREAYGLGFVNGVTADTFDPNGTLTREQAAAMLGRVYEKLHGPLPESDTTPFEDNGAIDRYAKSAVAFLAANGVVGGIGGNQFAPKKGLTVQEAVIMALRMVETESWTIPAVAQQTPPPKETEEPAETENPAEIQEPVDTEPPAETGEPTGTEEPTESESPIETEGPAGPGTPAGPEAPDEGTEPGGEGSPEEGTGAVG